MRLSAIVLTKNEERNIKDCLESLLDFADEILVIDSQSSDETVPIATKLGVKVINIDTWQGWGIKRQEAQKFCQGDWILHLDADERLTPKLKEELNSYLEKASGNEIFAIPRANHLFGQRISHCGWYPDFVLRCYKKSFTSYNDAKVHEHVLTPQGSKIIYLKEPLIHYTYQTVDQCFFKQKNYSLAFAEQKDSKGKKVSLLSIPFRGLFSFIRVYLLRGGILDGKWGLWNAISTATYTVNKYLALYAKNHNKDLR